MKFTEHILNTVTSANRLVGWIMRTFRRRSQFMMMTLWNSLVQSKLDYCSILWSPADQQSIKMLESVARNYTSKIHGLEEKDYWERLEALKILSQERRRERQKIVFVWKVLQGLTSGYSFNTSHSDRRGRHIVLSKYPANAPAAVRNAVEASMQVNGAKL